MKPQRTIREQGRTHAFWSRVRCALSDRHDPVHHPLGGFRCARCGASGANLEQLGFEGEGYVSEPARRRLARGGPDATGRAA